MLPPPFISWNQSHMWWECYGYIRVINDAWLTGSQRQEGGGSRSSPLDTAAGSPRPGLILNSCESSHNQPQSDTRGNRMLTSGIKHIKERNKVNMRRFSKGQLYCLVLPAMTIITHQEKPRFRVQMELAQQQARRLPQPLYSVLDEINPRKSMP